MTKEMHSLETIVDRLSPEIADKGRPSIQRLTAWARTTQRLRSTAGLHY